MRRLSLQFLTKVMSKGQHCQNTGRKVEEELAQEEIEKILIYHNKRKCC